jgi:hypothetical protein
MRLQEQSWYREGMLRKYPLTTLFIIATICVDLAIILASARNAVLHLESDWIFYAWNCLIPAQISTLVVWGVFGKSHRLTKAAVVTFGGAVIFLVHGMTLSGIYFDESMFVNLLQVSGVLIGSLAFRVCGLGRSTNDDQQPLRFSLIEMFGWSMIVALWAFAFRSSAARFPVDVFTGIWTVATIAAPLTVIPALFGSMSSTRRIAAFLGSYAMVLVVGGAAYNYYGNGPINTWALIMSVTQISYISAWWAVMRMDEAMQERQAIIDASREKLKVFEP